MKKLFIFLIVCILTVGMLSVTACNKDSGKADEIKIDGAYTGKDGDAVDGIKTFKTVQAGIDYFAGAGLGDSPKTMNIVAGTYKEKITVPKEVTNLTMLGATDGTSKLTYDDFAGKLDANGKKLGTDGSSTVTVFADGFTAKNIYFENTFDYLNPPKGIADLQGLAFLVKADKAILEKCTFTGYQDTVESARGRHYYKDCLIKGSVDFIFGDNATALFENCDIVSIPRGNKKGGYIAVTKGNNGTNGEGVPTYGFVFNGCRLTAEEGVPNESICLGRPWRADTTVAWLNCEMGAHIGKSAYGKGSARYTAMEGGGQTNYPYQVHFYEYGNTGPGATTEKLFCQYAYVENNKTYIVDATEPDFTLLTAEQAGLYTPENIFATTNGGVTYQGEWNPCK